VTIFHCRLTNLEFPHFLREELGLEAARLLDFEKGSDSFRGIGLWSAEAELTEMPLSEGLACWPLEFLHFNGQRGLFNA
jgi:hypothetical protein